MSDADLVVVCSVGGLLVMLVAGLACNVLGARAETNDIIARQYPWKRCPHCGREARVLPGGRLPCEPHTAEGRS